MNINSMNNTEQTSDQQYKYNKYLPFLRKLNWDASSYGRPYNMHTTNIHKNKTIWGSKRQGFVDIFIDG